MKTILVPIDFSRGTKWVVEVAADLARALRGRLVLLHVEHPTSALTDHAALEKTIAGVDGSVASTKVVPRSLPESELGMEPVKGDSLQLIGDPIPVILEQAGRLSADYIVMGSHGHSALYDMVVGSTTQGVLKSAECPVIIVPSLNGRASVRNRPTRLQPSSNPRSVRAG